MSSQRVAVIGAGGRGRSLSNLIASRTRWARIVAVAEPRDDYREDFAHTHNIEERHRYRDWRDLFAASLPLDAVVVTTMDRDHTEPSLAALAAGHHLLMEKPMAPSLEECERIAAAAADSPAITAVCHSLRYGRPFRLLKEVVSSGRIGTVVTVDHLEQVLWWHQAHSFVRGKWGNEGRSSFMLLAKSCHDVDYLAYLVDRPCRAVSSFGSLNYFRPEHAPAGSGERCVDCDIEPDCAYSAIKLYADTDREGGPISWLSLDHSRQAQLQAITDGPYGRCVWRCDNDVVDNQILALEFDGGATATFTMTGFTAVGGRRPARHRGGLPLSAAGAPGCTAPRGLRNSRRPASKCGASARASSIESPSSPNPAATVVEIAGWWTRGCGPSTPATARRSSPTWRCPSTPTASRSPRSSPACSVGWSS